MNVANGYKIFVDMDGVIVDFLQGCSKFFGYEGDLYKEWPEGVWGNDAIFQKFFGVQGNKFWGAIAFPSFWAELPWTSDGKELMRFLEQYDPTIMSIPIQKGADGKVLWIKRNLSHIYKNKKWVLCGKKDMVAAPNHILIDDSDANIKSWAMSGGLGILYPRPWNSLHWMGDPVKFVMGCVRYHTLINKRSY